eukprot:6533089-Prymnesium_polylepis.1
MGTSHPWKDDARDDAPPYCATTCAPYAACRRCEHVPKACTQCEAYMTKPWLEFCKSTHHLLAARCARRTPTARCIPLRHPTTPTTPANRQRRWAIGRQRRSPGSLSGSCCSAS